MIGGLTGLERERSSQFAGFRTHILVSIGSCITSITSVLLFHEYITQYPHLNMDPARLTAQVLSGIGFLGAGAILKTSNTIRGLTTAAGIWATACIGIAIGYGYYVLGICAWFLVVSTLFILKNIDKTLFRKEKTIFKVDINNINAIPLLYSKFERSKIDIKSIDIEEIGECSWRLNFFIVYDRRIMLNELVREINNLNNITNVDYLH